MHKIIKLKNEDATVKLGKTLAQHLAKHLNVGATVFLEGTLGAGKTTFCRGVLAAFGHSSAVKSPTYTLVEPYEFTDFTVYHFDLYRLGGAEELEYMGIRDYFESRSLRLIEWPDKGAGCLPDPDIRLSLKVSGAGREATLIAQSPVGESLLSCLV